MPTLLYPHLTVIVDTEPFYDDLVKRYLDSSIQAKGQIRKEISARCESINRWLVDHGYQCGRDYQHTEDGYRFADDGIATMFRLAWMR